MNSTFLLCVDLDGVVADYENAFRAFVAGERGVDPATLEPMTKWDFDGVWGIQDRDEYLALHGKAISQAHMFATMPAVEHASDVLWRLNDEHDVHIRIVTHRLVVKGGHDCAVADTVQWLQQPREDGRPLVPYRDICFIAHKAHVGGDMYIDDAPHNVEALRAAGFDTVVMDAAYNRHVPGPRANNWHELGEMVEAKIRWLAGDPLKHDSD
jgi:5'(3')-deoxyribonucleotidase